jgi:hypothetical protein
MHVPGISRPALLLVGVIATLLFATAALTAVAWATHHTSTHTRTLPAGTRLNVTSAGSDVKVVAGDAHEVRLITKERRSALGTPHVHVRYVDGRLDLDSGCSGADLFGGACSASFVLEIPRAMPVDVSAGSGDVHVDSPSHDIEVATSSGDVHVHASDPALVRVRATSGDVHLEVPDWTYSVRTRVTSGDRDVAVREDAQSHRRLAVSATSGDVNVEPDGS